MRLRYDIQKTQFIFPADFEGLVGQHAELNNPLISGWRNRNALKSTRAAHGEKIALWRNCVHDSF